jgi:CRP-like cAMP-binding protein
MEDDQLKLTHAPDPRQRLKEFLQRNFRLDEREWTVIEAYGQPQHLSKNEYFVREGIVCRKLAFLAEGVMRYTRFEESGDETTCYFMSSGDFVGDPESFERQTPSDKNLHAETDCELATISYDSWRRLTKEMPRFKEIMATIDRKTTMDLLHQRDFLIKRDAAARYQYLVEHYPHILQNVPLGHIASFLDITQQSLSRLRKQRP